MHANEHAIDTDALLNDLLDPSINAIAICQRHTLTLHQLTEFLQGPLFESLNAAANALSQARTKLLALDIAPKALAALLTTTQSDQESRQLNETIRKAATKLLTITTKSLPPITMPQSPPAQHKAQSESPIPEQSITKAPKPARVHTQPSAAPNAKSAHSPVNSSSNLRPSSAALRAAAGAPRACTPARNNHPP